MGKGAGMADPRSGLLRNLCSVILDAMPEVFFAENTPTAATNGSFDYLVQQLQPHYEISWMFVKAGDLGFSHERKRFFCVGVKRGYSLAGMACESMQRLLPAEVEPPRTSPTRASNWADQLHALGNAVVPAASYYAFLRLAGLKVTGLPKTEPEKLKLVFDPYAYVAPASAVENKNRSSPLITTLCYAKQWSTPRAGNMGPCHVLTERSLRDLPTMVRFERSTPKEARGWLLNSEWVEYLMGFPPGYTAVPGLPQATGAAFSRAFGARREAKRPRVEPPKAPEETRAQRAARRNT
jgi:hypothetical protein